MATVKNEGIKNYLHIGLRSTLQQIVNEYEKQNGQRNSEGKLFIGINPEDEKQYIAGLRSKDVAEKAAAKKGIKAMAIALIEDGKKNFAHPYLLPIFMAIVGNKNKRAFVNLEYDNGCFVIDGGKSFKPKQNAPAAVAVAPAPEAKDEQPEKKARKSKKEAAQSEGENAELDA